MSRLKKAMAKAKEAREMGAQLKEIVPEKAEEAKAVGTRPTEKTGGGGEGERQCGAGPAEASNPVCDEEINPRYCQTRRVKARRNILSKNKIVSMCHHAEVMADQIKMLRTQILNKMAEIGGKSLLVTSANPFEGKTLTAINLALSISHKLDHTVLLVDADLRKPSIHEYFGLDVNRGLSDYLLRRAEISELLVNPGIDKLVLLPGGKPLPNSAEHLAAPRMESLINEMKTRYSDRYIIVDSSSLLRSADPLVCSRFADGILLVVAAEKTPAKDIENALELLSGRNIIGTVLNKARG